MKVAVSKAIKIIYLVGQGKSTKVIAHEVGYSYSSTKLALSKIYQILGLDNRVQLAVWATEHKVAIDGILGNTNSTRHTAD